MLNLEKVATPATAATVVVPEMVPPAWFVPIATVTVPVKVGTRLPLTSSAVTSTGGAMCAPAAAALGCIENTSCVAAPGVMSKGSLVTPVRPAAVADSVYPVPVFTLPLLSMLRLENVATPATGATVLVPDRVAPPRPVPAVIATDTWPVKPGTALPNASCTVTCTAG